MSSLKCGSVVTCVLCFTISAFASEQDELRQRANGMIQKAEILAQKGHVNEAEDLERGAKKLLQSAMDLERDQADRSDSDKKRQKRKDIEAGKKKPNPDKLPEREISLKDMGVAANAVDRLKHVRIAVDNLHAAGLHELAKEAEVSAEKIEAEQRENDQQAKRKQGDNRDEAIEELRKEIQQIRRELKAVQVRLSVKD
jgi:hypothetical protein